MKKRILLLAVGVVCVFGLVGCSETETEDTEAVEVTETTEIVEDTEAVEDIDGVEDTEAAENSDVIIGELEIEGTTQEVELQVVDSELGVSMAYDSANFTYVDDTEFGVASITAIDVDTTATPNVFISVSKSEYSFDETVEGLKAQAFTEDIVESETVIGLEEYTATLLEMREGTSGISRVANFYVVENNGQVYIVEEDYFVEAEEGFGARLDMMLGTITFN